MEKSGSPDRIFHIVQFHAARKSDRLHLRAACGYVELGMFEEANAQLEEVDPFCRHLPEVLLARLAIYHGLGKWKLLAVVAKKLTNGIRKTCLFRRTRLCNQAR